MIISRIRTDHWYSEKTQWNIKSQKNSISSLFTASMMQARAQREAKDRRKVAEIARSTYEIVPTYLSTKTNS